MKPVKTFNAKAAVMLALSTLAFSSFSHSAELIKDGTFSTDTYADDDYGPFSSASPWQNSSERAGIFNPSSDAYENESQYGTMAYLRSKGEIKQNLRTTLTDGYTYKLKLEVGIRADKSYGFAGIATYLETASGHAIPLKISPVGLAATDQRGFMREYTGELTIDSNISAHANILNSGEQIHLVMHATNDNDSIFSRARTNIDNVSLIEISIQDKDDDGMDDAWEQQHNLDPRNPDDALLDTDKDGATNLLEFQAQTDPNDGSDYPSNLVAPTGKNIAYASGSCPSVGFSSNYKDCLSITLTTKGGPVSVVTAGGGYVCQQGMLKIVRDGTTQVAYANDLPSSSQGSEDFMFSGIDSSVPAGTHTYTLKAKDRFGNKCLQLDSVLLVAEEK